MGCLTRSARSMAGALSWFALAFCVGPDASIAAAPGAATTPAQLQQDWLWQAQLRFDTPAPAVPVTVAEDAAGGCDGHIDGKWGFHTLQEREPWWQVDLGQVVTLGKLVVYNRCDGNFAGRAAHLQVLLSDDGSQFARVYEHDGKPFHGHSDKQPLRVNLRGRRGRFVRLQLPGTVYFHLDEVEIYEQDSDINIALHRPALQSSVSQWSSRAPASAETLDWPVVVTQSLERGERLAAALQRRGVRVASHLTRLDQLRQQTCAPIHHGQIPSGKRPTFRSDR